MRRLKCKNSGNILKTSTVPEDMDVVNSENHNDSNLASTSGIVPDLSHFKFERKPHIKIEYEKKIEEKSIGLWEPPHWKEFLTNLRIMRDNNEAPVDTMGCHMTMDKDAPPEVIRYQSLIALMLSSQTKDQVTYAAMQRLRERGLTVNNILNMTDEELSQLIYPVGFYKTKVKYIKKTTQTLKEQYNGDIPDSVDKLCKLTGVGPKMAHICMKVAWNKVTGIGVDTHVHRISNRIGWVKKSTTSPEDTRKALQTWIPFDLWSEVNNLMVGFGQTICLPVSPLCHECLNNDICPSSHKFKKSLKKSPKTNLKVENSNDKSEVKMKSTQLMLDTNSEQKEIIENKSVLDIKDEACKALNTTKKHDSERKLAVINQKEADVHNLENSEGLGNTYNKKSQKRTVTKSRPCTDIEKNDNISSSENISIKTKNKHTKQNSPKKKREATHKK